jgi:hypothetical protein
LLVDQSDGLLANGELFGILTVAKYGIVQADSTLNGIVVSVMVQSIIFVIWHIFDIPQL